jgi:FMN phosphatase YigB (HAD superfamily)
MIKMVLFDLDGTLLPMDFDVFLKAYFGAITNELAKGGHKPDVVVKTLWAGIGAMMKNDTGLTNEEVFWQTYDKVYIPHTEEDLKDFNRFYAECFDEVKGSCGYNPEAAEAVKKIKAMGLPVALATSPVFPMVATHKRIKWAGLSPEDFELITSYENSRHTKPNPAYYTDVAAALGVDPRACLMVGNDVGDDMAAEKVGMKVFLLDDCLINKGGEDISKYPHGSFTELLRYVESIR